MRANCKKKYLKTNMARARIEKSTHLEVSRDPLPTAVEFWNKSISFLYESGIANQEFSTAATNKIFTQYHRMNSKNLIRKCESLENISNNILSDRSESPAPADKLRKEANFEWMKNFDVRTLITMSPQNDESVTEKTAYDTMEVRPNMKKTK